MSHIFLKDIIRAAAAKGSINWIKYFNIIIPALNNESISIKLLDDTEILNTNPGTLAFEYENKDIRYMIRDAFTDYFDEDKIKHSFHRMNVDLYIDGVKTKVDLYYNTSNVGFKKVIAK